MEEKKGRKFFFQSQGVDSNPQPSPLATITLHKDPWLQLLYKYHEGYILNSIAQYPMHMKEERESVIELNLKVQKTII